MSVTLRPYQTQLIYLARNRVNGKVYIGQTLLSLRERMGDHRRKAFIHGSRSDFHAAIREHGFNTFEWKVLELVLFREALSPREQYWIDNYQSADPSKGYNNTHGGDSFEFTEKAKKKIGLAGRGVKRSETFKENLRHINSGAGNPFFGKYHTEDAKAKNRAAHVGKKLKPEHVAKCIRRGEENGLSILTEEKVREIKRLFRDGFKQGEVCRRTGVALHNVKNIRGGYSWGHVQI